MSLKTYCFPENCLDFPFIHEDKCGHFHESVLGIRITDCTKHFAPGEWVKGRSSAGGKGMIVAVGDAEITILWSVEPASGVQMPVPRRVNMNLIANEIVKVQPMSLPSGLIFYLDYTYGATNKDETPPSGQADRAHDSPPENTPPV